MGTFMDIFTNPPMLLRTVATAAFVLTSQQAAWFPGEDTTQTGISERQHHMPISDVHAFAPASTKTQEVLQKM